MKTKTMPLSFSITVIFVMFTISMGCIPSVPRCGDLSIENVEITNRSDNSFHYAVQLKNVGLGDVIIDRNRSRYSYVQTYLSTDATLDKSDLPAGGYVLEPKIFVAFEKLENIGFSNETFNQETHCSYPYLIVVLRTTTSSNDCNPHNNIFIVARKKSAIYRS